MSENEKAVLFDEQCMAGLQRATPYMQSENEPDLEARGTSRVVSCVHLLRIRPFCAQGADHFRSRTAPSAQPAHIRSVSAIHDFSHPNMSCCMDPMASAFPLFAQETRACNVAGDE